MSTSLAPFRRTHFGRAHVEKLMRQVRSARTAVRNSKEKVSEIVGTAVRTAEVGGAAFALGAARGAYGPVDIMGVPLELMVGLGAHGAAVFLDDDIAKHLRGFGDGAVAAYAYQLGQETVAGGGGGETTTEGQGLDDRDLNRI